MFKVMLGVTAAAAVTASAGSFPFPQNMKYPHGHIIEYANTDVIKQHYESWKKAWYNASQGWVYAPEGTCSTVSEAIAYGMLISVYMDDQSVFDKLYGTWKSNGGNGGGMNWRVGCSAGSGSASDADFDAALALVMASKQWGGSYLNDAKSIISWIASNDISGNKIKPGNQWNDAFNPSYAATANFQLFQPYRETIPPAFLHDAPHVRFCRVQEQWLHACARIFRNWGLCVGGACQYVPSVAEPLHAPHAYMVHRSRSWAQAE